MKVLRIGFLVTLASIPVGPVGAQQPSSSSHHDEVKTRGAHVMGFDQEKTAHHFYLYQDGGAIDVAVKSSTDTTNLDAIRGHLPHIATMFSDGQFDAPMLVHATNVPGTTDMAKLKDRIAFTFVNTPLGGRVRIVTADPEALSAVHRFLRFQIADHQTGDSTEIRTR